MSRSKKFLIFMMLVLVSSQTFAGFCGEGKIIEVIEGGWNTNDLYIFVDYSVLPSEHPGTEYSGVHCVS